MKYFIGIDPGKNGGLALLTKDGVVISIIPMPVVGKTIDIQGIAKWIERNVPEEDDVSAYIEKVHAVSRPGAPKQGVVSMFTFGYNVGVVHGVIGTLGIPIHLVPPQTWKKHVLAGTKKDKNAAIEWCAHAFPSVSLLATKRSRSAHSGMADALCIAQYALMTTA